VDLLLSSTGSYPRIGESPEQQRHRRAYARRERGEISQEEFDAVQDAVTEEVIREQVEAGLDVVTDGQVRWYDPISHFARRLDGVEINGLLRYFDTNVYFRQPVIHGRLAWRAPLVVGEFGFARGVSAKPVKPVLTGPYTLARASVVQTDVYRRARDLTLGYAEALASEVRAVAEAGASLIQVDEPAILDHPEDLDLLGEALATLGAARGRAELLLCLYFGDAAPLYDELQRLPVEVLGLDVTYSTKLPALIAEAGSAKVLSLGLFDGRNTRLERREEILPLLDLMLPRLRTPRVYVGPSCGLEYLPRDCARAKLGRMREIRDAYGAGRRDLRSG
jgi:5-methyltetrahydropteroyltriglutamate--homocysteine methyltransferase